MIPTLPNEISAQFHRRLDYYKSLKASNQISNVQYLEKLAILKYDIDRAVDILHKGHDEYLTR